MMIWTYTIASVILVSLISLVGVFTLSLRKDKLQKLLIYLVSFAVGGLFGDALIHLLPESFEKIGINITTSLCILSGIFLFFILEKFLRWQHCHIPSSKEHLHPVATLNLIGDAVHNFLDGMIIAASYMVSIPIGIATTLAVIFHEIPQEIGDFGVLVHCGIPVKRALIMNLLSALSACIGALIVLLLGAAMQGYFVYLLPITAGGFLYIAGSDLIPELHEHNQKISVSLGQFICILLGVAVMAALLLLE